MGRKEPEKGTTKAGVKVGVGISWTMWEKAVTGHKMEPGILANGTTNGLPPVWWVLVQLKVTKTKSP